jgi:hypothetical protein
VVSAPRKRFGHPSAVIRDVVEIVAIILAGLWAIYTFIYVERIKPGFEEPRIVVTGSIARVGTRGNLMALRYQSTIHNTGTVPFSIVATAVSAVGIRYAATKVPDDRTRFDGAVREFSRDARVVSRSVVYSDINLTRFVDKKYSGGYTLGAGEEVPLSGTVLVRRDAYDEVEFDSSVALAKDTSEPLAVLSHVNSDGVIVFGRKNKDRSLVTIESTMGRAMLW